MAINVENENDLGKYIPGVCNIGNAEINQRRKGIYFALLLLAANVLVLQFFHANHWWRLTVFIPVIFFAISFQQVYYHFCAGFGMKGVFNFGDIGKTFTIEQKEYYRKDRAKALKMIISSVILAIGVALVYCIA